MKLERYLLFLFFMALFTVVPAVIFFIFDNSIGYLIALIITISSSLITFTCFIFGKRYKKVYDNNCSNDASKTNN